MSYINSTTPVDLSVIVPVHNEAGNVIPLIQEIVDILKPLHLSSGFEIIYVDDGSTDQTPDEVLTAGQQHSGYVRLLQHDRARGQSAALWSGAHAARGDWLITLDGDGQNDPKDIPQLLSATQGKTGALLVIGHRVNRHDNAIRKISSRIANNTRKTFLKDGTPDTGCGLKIMPRQTFLQLPYFDHMHRFLPALVQRHGGNVVSIPVHHRPRERGKSKYGIGNRLWVGIVDLFGVSWLRQRGTSAVHYQEIDATEQKRK